MDARRGPQNGQRIPPAGGCHEGADGFRVTGFELPRAPGHQCPDCTLNQEIEKDSAEECRTAKQERDEESDQPLGELQHQERVRYRARPQYTGTGVFEGLLLARAARHRRTGRSRISKRSNGANEGNGGLAVRANPMREPSASKSGIRCLR